jgi:hypothetical protein
MRLLVAASFAIVVLALNVTPAGPALAQKVSVALVKIVNTRAEPVPVSVVGAVGVQPWQQRFTTTLPGPAVFDDPVGSFTVPAGKRLVLEYVSGVIDFSQNGILHRIRIRTSVNGVVGDHYAVDSSTLARGVGQGVRIYADPGTTVEVAGLGKSVVTVTLSGHLETAP